MLVLSVRSRIRAIIKLSLLFLSSVSTGTRADTDFHNTAPENLASVKQTTSLWRKTEKIKRIKNKIKNWWHHLLRIFKNKHSEKRTSVDATDTAWQAHELKEDCCVLSTNLWTNNERFIISNKNNKKEQRDNYLRSLVANRYAFPQVRSDVVADQLVRHLRTDQVSALHEIGWKTKYSQLIEQWTYQFQNKILLFKSGLVRLWS